MHAAVVMSFTEPPAYREFPTPEPQGPNEILVDVIAAGLHPIVRGQANGSHYTSTHELPLIPGIDGVGRTADGTLRYFVLPDTHLGAMAEKTVIDLRRSIELPVDADPVTIAAAMNPAMSAWIALRCRITMNPGASVLVLGATGNAGRLALQVAKHLGAGEVVAASRNPVPDPNADVTITIEDAKTAADVDIVLDYVWGEPAAKAVREVITHRGDRGKPLAWVQIGSVAGQDAAIPSAALRAAKLSIVGSGLGSVSTGDILAELPELVAALPEFTIGARAVSLADVTAAWADPRSDHRVVLTPTGS
jgi:NADPH:quinone reductase-like Zn-dependent oxidoreductase